ncbi:MAG: hypothetical protein JOY91_15335, partial [Sinobacteraceae bacterium]|nr:hypothetical protein [Nevskiaceae bacterium]
GVETPAQLQILGRMRCDSWQGYLACMPVPADEIVQKLTAQYPLPQ